MTPRCDGSQHVFVHSLVCVCGRTHDDVSGGDGVHETSVDVLLSGGSLVTRGPLVMEKLPAEWYYRLTAFNLPDDGEGAE